MESEESKKQLQDFVADVGLPLVASMGGGGKGIGTQMTSHIRKSRESAI